MALKEQSQEMKDAYGQNFSQQDLTDPEENQVPQPLMTETSEEGDLKFAREKLLMPNGSVSRNVPRSTVKKANLPRRGQ